MKRWTDSFEKATIVQTGDGYAVVELQSKEDTISEGMVVDLSEYKKEESNVIDFEEALRTKESKEAISGVLGEYAEKRL